MEAEVEAMRKQLEELQTATPDETDTISDLKKELDEKERALYTLQVGRADRDCMIEGSQGMGGVHGCGHKGAWLECMGVDMSERCRRYKQGSLHREGKQQPGVETDHSCTLLSCTAVTMAFRVVVRSFGRLARLPAHCQLLRASVCDS